MPEQLISTLTAVEELGQANFFDLLLGKVRQHDIPVCESVTAADLVVILLVHQPIEIEKLFALQLPVARRKFVTFLALSDSLPELTTLDEERLEHLRRDLDDDFITRKRGAGLRIYTRSDDLKWMFMIRRGEATQREMTVDPHDGASRSITFRPARYDAIIYDADEGVLLVNARTRADQISYAERVGKHLFGDPCLFLGEGVARRYMLSPLSLGPDAIRWEDCPQIRRVSLTGLDWFHGRATGLTTRKRGADVYRGMRLVGEQVPPRAEISAATFRIDLVDGRRLAVRIVPPDQAVLGRTEDADIVMDWLHKRGLLLERKVASSGLTPSLVGAGRERFAFAGDPD